MEKLRIQDLLDVCQEMGISVAAAKRKKAILDVMRAQEVTEEEVEEVWGEILEKRKKDAKSEFMLLK